MSYERWALRAFRVNQIKSIADTLRDVANYYKEEKMSSEQLTVNLEKQTDTLKELVRKIREGEEYERREERENRYEAEDNDNT